MTNEGSDNPSKMVTSNGDPWPTPTKQGLLSVASLADALEHEQAARWPGSVQIDDRTVQMPVLVYGETMDQLSRLVYDTDLVVPFDWSEWREPARRLIDRPAELAGADLVTIQKLMTLHFRSERFCEGHLAAMHESGHLVAVLRRIGEIAEGMA